MRQKQVQIRQKQQEQQRPRRLATSSSPTSSYRAVTWHAGHGHPHPGTIPETVCIAASSLATHDQTWPDGAFRLPLHPRRRSAWAGHGGSDAARALADEVTRIFIIARLF
ncbi:unnamed protein product, partial [Mycena citricolor]